MVERKGLAMGEEEKTVDGFSVYDGSFGKLFEEHARQTLTMCVGQIDPKTIVAVELPDGRKMSRTIGEFVELLEAAGAFAPAHRETDDEAFVRAGRAQLAIFDRGKVSDTAVEKFCADLESRGRIGELAADYEARMVAALKKRLCEPQFAALLRPWSRLVELGEITADDARDLGEAAALGVDR
jgi:hypothetical protein